MQMGTGSPRENGEPALARAVEATPGLARAEIASRAAELASPSPGTSSLPAPLLPTLPATPPPLLPSAIGTQPLHTDSPIDADDGDLIEQAWVDKAKAIVERTRDDPYNQNKEISKFKADYLQKRYKKDIKVSEA